MAMRRSFLLLMSLLLAPAPVLAGGGTAPPALTVPHSTRPLWTAQVDRGSGIAGGGSFGVYALQQGHLVGLDNLTGRVKWRSQDADRAGTPLFQWPNVVASHVGGSVAAYDALTGQTRWSVGGGNGPVRLARGPSTRAAPSSVLAFGQHIVLALENQTGRFLWRVDAVSAEHTVFPVETHSGPTLILHSPSEGFLGRVYTAHGGETGRELWRVRAGNGYLLGDDKRGLVFDLRDSHNLLGPGGTVRAGFVDPDTGKLTRGTLRVGVPDARAWQLEPGTLRLDGAGGTWALAVRVRDGAARLIHTPAKGKVRIWTLPGQAMRVGDGASVRLDGTGFLVGLPDGGVTLVDPQKGTQRIILTPGGGLPDMSWVGGVLAMVRDDQTVFLDESGRIRLRVPGRADAWTTGGDREAVLVQRGQTLSAYRWPQW